MRKVMVLAAVLFGFIFTSGAYAQQKMGYIDFTKVFGEYYKTKDYDKVFREKQDAYESGREKIVTEIKQFQDKMNLLNEKERENKKGELEAKIKNLNEFDRQNQVDLRKEQEEKVKELFKDIDDTVKQYAAKEGYTYIFHDKALAYVDKSLDITDSVLAIVNKNKPAGKK